MWPYAIYLLSFLIAITRKESDTIGLAILLLVPTITVLPFFTGHYWWAMAAGFCLLIAAIQRAFKYAEPGSGGALSVIGGFFYLMAAFGSILIYAILY